MKNQTAGSSTSIEAKPINKKAVYALVMCLHIQKGAVLNELEEKIIEEFRQGKYWVGYAGLNADYVKFDECKIWSSQQAVEKYESYEYKNPKMPNLTFQPTYQYFPINEQIFIEPIPDEFESEWEMAYYDGIKPPIFDWRKSEK